MTRPTARIVQLSDTHLVREGHLAYGAVDSGAALARAVETVARLPERTGPVDLVLVTGDIADTGDPAEYARFRALTAALPAPMAVIPGNHDAPGPFREGLAGLAGVVPSGPLSWSRRTGPAVLAGLDSTVPGAPHGLLGIEALACLDRAIAEAAGGPLIVALHHPPFETGIGFMDAQRLGNPDDLTARLGAHAGPALVVCGHVHRMILASGGPVPMAIAPSPAHAVCLDQRDGAPPTLMHEPGGVLLHEVIAGPGAPMIRSQVVPTGRFAGPDSFLAPSGPAP